MNNTFIKEIRTERGLTQGQLAAASGINVRMIQHYEQGSKDLKKAAAETVLKIAKALNCTVEDLIGN